jgi:hypothetical protein
MAAPLSAPFGERSLFVPVGFLLATQAHAASGGCGCARTCCQPPHRLRAASCDRRVGQVRPRYVRHWAESLSPRRGPVPRDRVPVPPPPRPSAAPLLNATRLRARLGPFGMAGALERVRRAVIGCRTHRPSLARVHGSASRRAARARTGGEPRRGLVRHRSAPRGGRSALWPGRAFGRPPQPWRAAGPSGRPRFDRPVGALLLRSMEAAAGRVRLWASRTHPPAQPFVRALAPLGNMAELGSC